MTDVHGTFASWRQEIEQELADARAALLVAEDELGHASRAAAQAKRDGADLAAVLERLGQPQPAPAAAVMRRVDERLTEGRRMAGAVALAKGNVQAIQARITDLALAILQIDQMLPAEVADAA